MARFDNEADINIASARAKGAQVNADQAQAKITALEMEVAKLLSLSEALWSIIKESHKLEDPYLIDLLKQVQEKNGTSNGRLRKKDAAKCSDCGKPILKSQSKCMYCGGEAELSLF